MCSTYSAVHSALSDYKLLIMSTGHTRSLSVLLLLFDVQIRLSSCRGRGNSVVSVPSSRDIHSSLSALP
jgi:hypothetical protein